MGRMRLYGFMLRDGTWMNHNIDSELLEHSRKLTAMKYIALALCLALFVAYGLVVG